MIVPWWHTPHEPLRTNVIRACVLGLLATTGVALTARASLPLSTWYPLQVVALYSVAIVMAAGLVEKHHPYDGFGAANHVTMIRAALTAALAGLIGEPVVPRVAVAAATAIVLMTVLDGVDGWLARRSRMTSAFGARFDMETDAVLVLVASLLVWQHGKAGAWVVIGGLLRYAFVAAGWLLPWMARPLGPTRRARIVAVSHLIGLGAALTPIISLPISAIVAAVTLTMIGWSFAVDVRRLWRME